MILSGHQPNYLPYPGLFAKILLSDQFMYVTQVQFDKKSWQNRNRILTANGWIWLTVPVLTKNKFQQKICQVEINNTLNWREKHFNSIRLNYAKTPYYNKYIDLIEMIYKKEWNYLSELNIFITNEIIKELGIKTKVLYDYNFHINGSKTDMLIELCKNTYSDTYLSNKGSENYVDLDIFKNAEIDHFYLDYIGQAYRQNFDKKFSPNLSIIDMLFNCGEQRTKLILQDEASIILSEKNKKI